MLHWHKIRLKYLKVGPHGIAAFAIIVFATLLRILLSYQGWPQTNSDESTMGLMALHIAYRGEYPIFFYGQAYMGSLEAYLGAAFFQLFGPSVFTLRLGVMLIFASFLASMYLLTSRLYTKKMAIAVLVLLSLGPPELLFLEIMTNGGYPEMPLFAALLFLVTCWLALSLRPDIPAPQRKWRILVYGGWGFIAGVGIWSDLLILPFVFTTGLLLIRFCRSELRRPTIFSLILGLVIGLSPMIIYYATVPVHDSTLGVIGIAVSHDAIGHITSQPSLTEKLAGTLLVALPKQTGASALCSMPSAEVWPLSAQSSPYIIECTIIRTTWGLGFLILWAVAAILAARAFWKLLYQQRTSGHAWSEEERQSAIRHFARLMLLGSAGITLLLFALSQPAALTPLASSRYLTGLLVATPAVIWPLWRGLGALKPPLISFATVRMVLRYAALFAIGIVFLTGTVATFARTPGAQAGNLQQDDLIRNLLHIGARHIYSEYWTCDRIIFVSQEQIICSVLNEQLQPGYDRYLPYRSIVRSDPHAAYVFPVGSPQAKAFAQKVGSQGQDYQRFAFDDYVIYQPLSTPTGYYPKGL